ncbi:MAG TPA: citrate/2-methylcitrate synthase [Thermomicrobiales bacterium]|nr:citrate/2-methylcitrate synthase [Thermomicrobiales bacterium]
MSTEVQSGLDGIKVARTALSSVDGERGILKYRGYNIDQWVNKATFEEVAYLMWYGEWPTRAQLDDLNEKLTARRSLTKYVEAVLRELPTTGAPIDSLKITVTVLAMEDENEDSWDIDDLREKSITTTAIFPTALAAYHRLRNGQEPLEPLPEYGSAANFLYMVNGERPTENAEKAFDTYLALLAEHSMNASTFTARSTISSTTDYYSAINSALGSLKGIAHGGANMMAMKMLMDIGSPDKVKDYVDESLEIGRRIMGIGHRIYKVRDPRVNHLMAWSEKIAAEVGDNTWYEMARTMEELTNDHPYFTQRGLYPNVEFYSAPLLYNLGFPPDLMPAVFGISRVVGWSANIMEQVQENRLMRPQALYVGEDEQEFVPIEQRG